MSQAGSNNSGSIGPTVPTSFVTDAGTAIPSANVLNINGGTDISTAGAGNTIVISFTGGGGGFTWSVVTSASNPVSLVAGNGYIPKGATAVSFVLPAAASVGDTFRIAGYGNLWTLAQNAGQSVIIGSVTSTAGATGSVSATMVSDSLELVCVTANTEFKEVSIQGNPTIV
jgi:hypothetical protein